jgi:hypothetical protein
MVQVGMTMFYCCTRMEAERPFSTAQIIPATQYLSEGYHFYEFMAEVDLRLKREA